MAVLRSLSLVIGMAAVATFAACGDDSAEDDGGSAGAGTNGAGASTGATGGSGGSPMGSGGSTSASTGSGPIQCTSEYTNATGDCDLLDPSTCPAGNHCSYVDNNGTLGCVANNPGVKGMGEACTTDAECSGVLECIANKCSTFCCPDNNLPCGQAGGLCDLSLTPQGAPTIFALACSFSPSCTLLEDTCPMGTDCHPAAPDQALAVCDPPAPGGLVGEGNECTARNDCDESEVCNTNETPSVCRALCNVTDWMTPSQPFGGCPNQRTCTGVNWGNNQWNHIGICLPEP